MLPALGENRRFTFGQRAAHVLLNRKFSVNGVHFVSPFQSKRVLEVMRCGELGRRQVKTARSQDLSGCSTPIGLLIVP